MSEAAITALITGLGSALTAIGFWATAKRNAASTYTQELERRNETLRQDLKAKEDELRLTKHDLAQAEQRIDTLIDRLRDAGR